MLRKQYLPMISVYKIAFQIFFIVFLLRGSLTAHAQCIEGDCNNGFGTAVFKKQGNVRYTGNFQNKRPQGQGMAEYPNGRKYEGEWHLGMWHGVGTLTLTDGTTLSGNWEFSRFKGAVNYPTNTYKVEVTKEEVKRMNTPTPSVTNSHSSKQMANTPDVRMPQTWALAIGVADYENPTIPRLKYPDNDAFAIYAFWKSTSGGSLDDEHSRVLVDDAATRSSIKNAMKDLYKKANEDDLVVFFFSGHGLKGSFLPTDYDGGDVRLYHSEINKILEECPAKHKLVIADACHSGSYVATKGVSNNVKDEDIFYNILNLSQPGTAFILSSLAEEESLEVSTLHNSVFTHFVLRGMKGEADINKDRIVTVRELFDYVYENVTTYAASLQKVQTPVLKGNFDPNMPVAIIK